MQYWLLAVAGLRAEPVADAMHVNVDGLNAVLVLTMGPMLRSLHGLLVLVIDDHSDTVDVLLEYLTAQGATALGAGSAKAGLAIAEARVLDAVVVDLRMPRQDGWWFLSQLRASPTASAHAPVYAMTGERHDYLDPASGFAGYFFKPVNLDALVAALADLPHRPK